MKSQRQQLILKIISENNIDTQENLQRALKEHGCAVTQATVSRDIKELALIKTMTAAGNYKYSIPSFKKDALDNRGSMLYTILSDAVREVDYAVNTVVVKCNTGMAQAVCAKLDGATIDNTVGTIAGDDTIFILMRTERDAVRLVKELNGILNAR
ncbi:MAG: arginine repressor [Ruminococcus sp.]|nr:arginine repressor [Ruminococcus sp.]